MGIDEKNNIMAGSYNFKVDDLEVW